MGHVLLIEPDQLLARRILGALQCSQNLHVEVTCSGMRGLWMAAGQQPDVIVLDVDLIDIESVKVYQRLKNDPRTMDIPIVVLVEPEHWSGLADTFPHDTGDLTLPTNAFVQFTLFERLRGMEVL